MMVPSQERFSSKRFLAVNNKPYHRSQSSDHEFEDSTKWNDRVFPFKQEREVKEKLLPDDLGQKNPARTSGSDNFGGGGSRRDSPLGLNIFFVGLMCILCGRPYMTPRGSERPKGESNKGRGPGWPIVINIVV